MNQREDKGRDPTADSTADTQPPAAARNSTDLQPGPADTVHLFLEVRTRPGIPAVQVPMTGGRLVIGREEGDVRIEDLLVSRQHASIELQEGEPTLHDLDSTNGTFLNGRLLIGPAAVHDGDDIRIGPSHLLVRIARD